MPVPLTFITRIFQLVSERKFAEAERVFERIRTKLNKSKEKEFDKGFLDAINGVILTSKSGSGSYEFFSNIDLSNTDVIKRNYKDFRSQIDNRFHSDYDRGYFTALSEYTRIILKNAEKKNSSL